MIKELTYKETVKFIPLLEKNPSLNLFFLNNIKLLKFGIDYKVYHTPGLLMMHSKFLNIVLYKYDGYDVGEVAHFIEEKKPISINGPKDALSQLEGILTGNWETTYPPMMSVTKEDFTKCVTRSDNLSFLLTYEYFL